MIKTIIFDLGNVIVPFEIDKGLKNFAKASDLSSAEVRQKAYRIKASKLYHEGKISASKLFDSFKKSLGLRMDFDEFTNAWNSIFLLESIVSEDLIRKLSEKYRLILLSDTNELHFNFIKLKFPLLKHFDEFVLSHEVGQLKPSPKMYQTAVEKAECLAEECFFTDDKIENVDGAKKFGINAVQFISAEQFEKHLVDFDLLKK